MVKGNMYVIEKLRILSNRLSCFNYITRIGQYQISNYIIFYSLFIKEVSITNSRNLTLTYIFLRQTDRRQHFCC